MIHIVKGFGVVNETGVDVSLEFPSFLCDPENVGSLISVSSSFSKHSLNIWKFLVHIMLKPSMQDFKHDLTSMGDECNCPMVSTFCSTTLRRTGMRIDLFQSCGPCLVFQICWYIECNILMASSCRILNNSTGILSHPLALLIAVRPKADLTSLFRMFGSGWLTTLDHTNPVHLNLFYIVLPCIISISSWFLQCLLGLYHLCPLLCPSLGKIFPWYLQFSWRDI